MKILIVEDEHKTGDYLKRGLSEPGFVVVIFLTARDRVDERVKGLELGADDYLVKRFWMTTSNPSPSARSGR